MSRKILTPSGKERLLMVGSYIERVAKDDITKAHLRESVGVAALFARLNLTIGGPIDPRVEALDPNLTYGQLLREFRGKRTQASFERETGINATLLRSYETGRQTNNPSLEQQYRWMLSQRLNVPTMALFVNRSGRVEPEIKPEELLELHRVEIVLGLYKLPRKTFEELTVI
jgi:hypothetical protein